MATINSRIIATLIVPITDLESAINVLSTRNIKQGKVRNTNEYSNRKSSFSRHNYIYGASVEMES